jgi:hypothetical protein
MDPALQIRTVAQQNIGKESGLRWGLRIHSPKVFVNSELLQPKQIPHKYSHSPNNLSKLLNNLHSKIKKNKEQQNGSNSAVLKKFKNKLATNSFIEKVRTELEGVLARMNKKAHNRSLSDNYKGGKSVPRRRPKVECNNLVVIPAPIFPTSVKNFSLRKDSFPDCGVDFHRIDLPYAKKYFESPQSGEYDGYNLKFSC